MRVPFHFFALAGAALLPGAAAASAPPVIESEFLTVDLGSLPRADVAAPQAQPAVAPDLSKIDRAYLNRHVGRNLDDSIAALRSLLADQTGNPDLLWRLARGLHAFGSLQSDKNAKLKAFQESETLLTSALSRRPDDAVIHYWLGRVYGSENEIKRTLGLVHAMRRELEAAIRLDPRLADAHHFLGELLRRIPGIVGGDKHKAVAELEEAVRLAPNEASHYPALAEAYLDVKDKPRAIEAARKTFTIKTSDDPGAYDDSVNAARELLQRLGAS